MTDEVTDFDHNDAAMQDFDALSELDSLFEEDERLKQAENNVLTGESSEQVQRLVVVDLPGALPLETLAWSPVE